MVKKEIINATILTMVDVKGLIQNGFITIEGNTIVKLGPMDAYKPDSQAEVFDAQGMVLMPGFVNAHTHCAMNLMRGIADDVSLQSWLYNHVFPEEARILTPENVRQGIRAAMVEMIRCGTTCFNDMYFFQWVMCEELERVGLRAVVGESLSDYAAASYATPDEGLEKTEEMLIRYKNHPTIHPSVCAHAPYTCSDILLRRAATLAQRSKVPFHIHVAETQKEVDDVKLRTGRTPVAHLAHIGVLRKNTVIAHGVWLSEGDQQIIAATKVSVAHCPKSNLKLASGIADVASYLKKGINVAIGTDSVASNNTLDMVEEMRFASLLPKVHNPEAVPAFTALQMATVNGARALGLESLVGIIRVGRRADLILIDMQSYNLKPCTNIYSTLVYAMNSRDVHSSMVNGRWIMRNRKVLFEEEMN